MKLFNITFLAAITLLIGCDQSPQIPGSPKDNYPVVIRDSSDRRALAEREWRRMLDTFEVPPTPPDLYPIIYTPRTLLGVSNGIKILAMRPDPGSETIVLREAVKTFIDRWRDLLGVDPEKVSLISASESGQIRRLTYRQASYPFPVAGIYGEMTAVISEDGRLLQLDDRFIPTVELPTSPRIEKEAAAQKVVGRTFTYSDFGGREQRVRINSRDEVSVKRLVVLPMEKESEIEIHLAWEIIAGQSLTWTVYVDAITGDELRAVQNFQT